MSAATGPALLKVRDLHVSLPGPQGRLPVVRGMDLELRAGERVGLVGESGSGKTMLTRAVLGLLPPGARVSGEVTFRGEQLLGAPGRTMRRVRGRGVAVVFQDPAAALNPVRTVGSLLAEVLTAAGTRGRRRAAADVLARVGLGDVDRVLRSFPSELSGGQRQRVLIALAIVNRPAVILADEPTTALDVTVQAQVLATLREVTEELGAALLLISHDLAVVAGHTSRTLVTYAGRVVEAGPTADVFTRPRMPYTAALLAAHPSVARRAPVEPIPGQPPDPAALPSGCPFAPRCGRVAQVCRSEPEPAPVVVGAGHTAACRRVGEP